MNKLCLDSDAVIMCGVSGSGKTHYARLLEEQGYIRLSIDSLIWEKAGAGLFSLKNDEKRRLFASCREQVCQEMVELLKSEKKVVVDATHCHRSARDEIRNLCAEIDVKPLFLYCRASEEELWARLSQRTGKGPDDLIVTREELAEYCRGFEAPQPDEIDVLHVHSDCNY